MKLQVQIKKELKNFTLNVDFSNKENIVGILGNSGCGKSMTLKSIGGIVIPDSGEIILNDKILFNEREKINLTPQKRKVGYLFQNYALFPNMTVEDNIGISLLNTDKEFRENKIREMIDMFQLKGLEKHYPKKLSGGEQQRTALARVLAYNPDVLLLDEPFSALDAHLKIELRAQMKEILENFRGISIIVSHDRDDLKYLTKELFIMKEGVIILKEKTSQIMENPINYYTAVMTGVKNISPIKVISEMKIYAIDWGMEMELSEKLGDNIKYIGIKDFSIDMKEIQVQERILHMTEQIVLLEE
ncbi:sulfate/molybdate ABC transporter ATP-binding protein [Fusobacterium sp. PH5-44]|uniref:sulfate/molybdate ABC transporter ATP-binding protein n=1 Tax=unclassified Fusobacterium TaxID=2648384 RepID=UPI003D19E63F